ncbi:MAG: RagB/SusD family nutrient uptake outer membrane protein [Leadbetterella sp.]|nr:RagB/SusD family nutrient uptake outer membrane protein [Leadbetterella sp.]
MKRIKKYLSVIALSSVMLVGCDADLLDVPNQNQPDFLKVYAKGDDVANVASGLYNTIFKGLHHVATNREGLKPLLAVAADNVTCSHGNFGMWHASSEPRDLAWDNSPSYSNEAYIRGTYNHLYSAIATANNVIKAIESGVNIGPNGADNDKVMAFARFIQGVAYSHMALIYDRAHVVDEVSSVEGVLETAVPYNEVAAKALEFLDKSIALSNGNFTIPGSWMGVSGDISSADFKKIVNTNAAILLSYMPRNKTELAGVSWDKVKAYADAGITSDITIIMDGTTLWYDEAGDYLTYDGWGKTDMYVVHLMDPKQPNHWGNSANPGHVASTTADDQRLFSDFQYTPSNGSVRRGDDFNFFELPA